MMVVVYTVLLFLIFYFLYVLIRLSFPIKRFKKIHNKSNEKKSVQENIDKETIKVYPDGRVVFPKRVKEPEIEQPLKDGYKRLYLNKGYIDYKPPEYSLGNPIDDMLASMYNEAKEKPKKKTRKNRKVPYNFKYSSLELRVAGTFYRTKKAKKVARCLKIGDPVYLIMEPYNIHDEFAVKVIAKNEHIGYIPSFYARRVTYGIMLGGYNASVSYKRVYIHEYFGDETIDIEIYLIPINKKSDN